MKELKYIVDSKKYSLEVYGGVHMDPGHTSGMIGQYNEIGEYVPALVKDTYVRFKVNLNIKNAKKEAVPVFSVLNTLSVFHYLVGVPVVVSLPVSANKKNRLRINWV
jgi:hypothetical protein